MAHVETAQLSKSEHDELCCAYAALLLHDDGQEISVLSFYFFTLFHIGRQNCESN